MQNNHNKKRSESQLFTFEKDSYLERTARPIYSLMYIFFFVIIYELGVFMLNPDLLNRPLSEIPGLVVAFAWVHNLLTFLGLSNQLAWMGTPCVVVIILIALQFTSKTSFKVKAKDFLPMTLECIAWAVPLIIFSLMLSKFTVGSTLQSAQNQAPPSSSYTVSNSENPTNEIITLENTTENADGKNAKNANSLTLCIVTGIGAGIYEELIFRLCLICLLFFVLKDLMGFTESSSLLFAVVASALLFSLHHHFYFLDGEIVRSEAFVPIKFAFRTFAGIYLGVVYVFRGFGIAAATHIFHNIIATLMNAYLFSPDSIM